MRSADRTLRSDAVEGALKASHLAELPPGVIAELLVGARVVSEPAGVDRHREGDQEVHFEVVIDGLARVVVTAPDGRSMTIRYCRKGAILGALSLYRPAFLMPATVHCLIDSQFLALDAQRLRALADQDPRIAAVLLGELSERANGFIAEIPGSVFATVRQRTARHLLDLADGHAAIDGMEVHVSQADLAESVGTAREVMVRILRAMRRDGLVETRRGVIIVLDPVRLAGETFARPESRDLPLNGTRVPDADA